MELFNKKIKIDNEEFWLAVDKRFYWSGRDLDYYIYECKLYKEIDTFFKSKKKKVIYSYETEWNNYGKYHGDIDKVIDEAINSYKEKLRKQAYISEKEKNFKSKYEV